MVVGISDAGHWQTKKTFYAKESWFIFRSVPSTYSFFVCLAFLRNRKNTPPTCQLIYR